ncbi:MAG: hypothetical protein LLG01_08160 [Planctomycetaceae bacterium]|nr:hypothetical protein [Planctomycetaceae bacterium]
MSKHFTTTSVLKALKMVGESLDWPGQVEILLVGGVAGMATGLLQPERTTGDCDVADLAPSAAATALEKAAAQTAERMKLPPTWLNDKAGQLNVLPDGWRSRREHIATYGKLKIYAASRLDLLAMKVFAHRATDRHDIAEMRITPEEVAFVRKYLTILKVPSRKADLDQVAGAEKYLRALEETL